jgi:glutamate N-acetyltransferase/amino-acid N-acetyltransferase
MQVQVPLPQGFRTAGLHCGIKNDPNLYDLALFVSDVPCTAAGVFTQNKVCGAPVQVSRSRVPSNTTRAVIINSGNANACTGERGLEDACWMTAEVASLLGCSAEDVLVCSTGVIGHFLPKEKLETGILAIVNRLSAKPQALTDAAMGMMTTDTFPKQAIRETEIGGNRIMVSGAAKGAAMIGPNMATMLAIIMTDAALSPKNADEMLRHAVNRSFHCISVEGHTSTSDTVILLAKGTVESRGVSPRTAPVRSESEVETLQTMINEVCEELATAIIRDAEGADHFVTIDVRGLRTRDEAHRIAKSVAEAPLVKTAITGADPNWGRIVSAAGYAGVDFEEKDVSLKINGTLIYQAGSPVEYDEKSLSEEMRANRDVHIELQVTLGDSHVRFWTSDLTAEYVRLNSEYTT